MNSFPDLQAGARGVLFEATTILNRLGAKYIVVGGWSPYLLNSKPIQHPGTKDVDILFDGAYNSNSLKNIILGLLEHGFILSAKHDFQLFKEIAVGGQKFVYNLDLLHPLETSNPKEIYVEHIDLGIPASEYLGNTFTMKSIALPSSQALFDFHLYSDYKLDLEIDGGETVSNTFPLMSELGTLITKSKSILDKKRYRDALDIYLAIKQNGDYHRLIQAIIQLKKDHPETYQSLYGIRKAFDTKILHSKFLRFNTGVSIEELDSFFVKFLNDSGLDQLIVEEDDSWEEEE